MTTSRVDFIAQKNVEPVSFTVLPGLYNCIW